VCLCCRIFVKAHNVLEVIYGILMATLTCCLHRIAKLQRFAGITGDQLVQHHC